MQPQIERFQHPEKHGHGGHGGHGEHDEHGEEGEGDEEEKSEDQGEGGEEDSEGGGGNEDKSDDSASEGEGKDTPDTSDDEGSESTVQEKEGGQDVEGVQFKGATSSGTEEGEQGDTRKHIPDAKGFNKKRIESDYGGKEGEAQKPEQDPSDKDLVSFLSGAVEDGFFLLILNSRLLHPNLRETCQHNQGSRKDYQTPTPSTPPILPIALIRALKVKAARRQPKTKEQSILKDRRSEKLDSTVFIRLRTTFPDQYPLG